MFVTFCSLAWTAVSFTTPPYFRISFLMKLYGPLCYCSSWNMYVKGKNQHQKGRQRYTFRCYRQLLGEVLKDNLCVIWRFQHCWVKRNISIQLCLRELYTYSKYFFYSLILPAIRYPDNCNVCTSLNSKRKPVFNTYFFHSYKSITFVY